jgi:hypothetical protein
VKSVKGERTVKLLATEKRALNSAHSVACELDDLLDDEDAEAARIAISALLFKYAPAEAAPTT